MFILGKTSIDNSVEDTAIVRLYRRWHASGLIALGVLGWLTLSMKKLDTDAGKLVSGALFTFHGLATLAHYMAAFEDSSASPTKPTVPFSSARGSPHLPLSIAFLAHTVDLI